MNDKNDPLSQEKEGDKKVVLFFCVFRLYLKYHGSTVSETFAFQMGDEWIVNGEGFFLLTALGGAYLLRKRRKKRMI